MSSVTANDLAQLGEICSKICYHLTAFIKDVADGKPAASTSDVSKLYQLATALPAPTVARHFGYNNGAVVKNKYNELKGAPREGGAAKKKKAEGEDGDKPEAKKAKKEEAKPAAAAPTPATGGAGGDWTKKQGQDLVKLVEDEEERKKAFGKRKLRWKSIAKHFDKHRKDCRKQYTKLTGKEAPEDDE